MTAPGAGWPAVLLAAPAHAVDAATSSGSGGPARAVAIILVGVLGLWIASIVSRGGGTRRFTLYSGTRPMPPDEKRPGPGDTQSGSSTSLPDQFGSRFSK